MSGVRLGCVGLGEVFEVAHFPILEAEPRIRVTAVADVAAERRRPWAERLDCPAVDSWRDLAARPDVDAVLICTPHHLHCEPALAALNAGKHVFVEKPMASSRRDCERMTAAARAHDTVLMVAENYCYEPGLQQIAELIRTGAIGRLTGLRLLQANPGTFPPPGHWRWAADAGGGVVLDPGVHLFAVARWWAGPIARVRAELGVPTDAAAEVEDTAEILFQCDSGVVGHLAVNWRAGAIQWRYEVQGSDGILLYDSYRNAQPARLSLVDAKTCREFTVPTNHSSPESYRGEWNDFLGSVLGQNACGYPGTAGTIDVALIEAAYESARTGTWAAPATPAA